MKRSAAALAACLGFAPVSASAVVIMPGQVGVVLPGTTVAASPERGGMVLDTVVVPFASGDLSGKIESRVVKSATTGKLVFETRLFDFMLSGQATGYVIGGYFLNGYDSNGIPGDGTFFMTDVDALTDSSGDVAADEAERDTNESTLQAIFTLGINSPDDGRSVSVLTDAMAWDRKGAGQVFGDIDGVPFFVNLSGLHSPTAIPLPAADLSLVAAIGALAAVRRRRGRD